MLRFTHISGKTKFWDLKLNEVWQYRDLILLFTKRDFSTTYKQTILGPLWLFITPILTSVINMVVFGNIAKLGTDGVPQFLFYLSGNAIWAFFSGCVSGNAKTFTGHASLFGKVYFPRLTVPLSNILSNCIRFFIQMVPVAVLMAFHMIRGTLVVQPLRWFLIPLILLVLGMMGMGIGILISSATTKYRDLSVLVGFGLGLWMYATPVVYPMSEVSNKLLRTCILCNPASSLIELFRYALLGVGTIQPIGLIYGVGFAIVVLVFGILIFNHVERTFMDTV